MAVTMFSTARESPALRRGWVLGGAAELLVAAAMLPLAAAAMASFGSSPSGPAYAHWWGTMRAWQALARTLELSAMAAAIAVAVSWALSGAAVRCSRGTAVTAALLSCLPLLVPASSWAKAWSIALGIQSAPGLLLAQWTGFSVYSMAGASVVLALRYAGAAAVVLTYHRLRQLQGWPAEKVFGVRGWRAAADLHARPAARAAAVAALLVMLLAMNDHVIPADLLISTYGTQVMIQYSLQDAAGAAALAVPVAGVGMAMVTVALWAGRKSWTAPQGPPCPQAPPGPLPLRLLGGGLAAAVLAAVLAAPVGVLAWQAGSWSAVASALQTVSEGHGSSRAALQQTAYCVAVAAPLSAVAGAVLARRWVARRQAGLFTAAPLVFVNLSVPASLLAIGVIELTQAGPLALPADSSWPLILAVAVRFLPVATLAFYAAWRGEGMQAELAAAVHHVPAWRTWLQITWPPRLPVLAAGAGLCGLLIATEVEISVLLQATGSPTLGVRLSTLIHTAPDSISSALSLGILLLVAPGVVLTALLWRWGRAMMGANR